jgi:hypothetical protein
MSSPLTVFRFSCWHFSEADDARQYDRLTANDHKCRRYQYIPSLVIKDMNSDTHSCMHSFASLAILAFSGSADFMILATGAKFCMLASVCKCALSAAPLEALDDERCCGGEEDDCGDEEGGIAIRASHHPIDGCKWLAFRVASDSMQTRKTRCAYCRRYM